MRSRFNEFKDIRHWVSLDKAQRRVNLHDKRFEILLGQVLNKTGSKIFRPIRHNVEGNKEFRAFPVRKLNRALLTMGTVQWLHRVLTLLSFSHCPPDCVDGNGPFSRVRHINSKMFLKGGSVTHNNLHQAHANLQTEFFNALGEVESNNGCGDT